MQEQIKVVWCDWFNLCQFFHFEDVVKQLNVKFWFVTNEIQGSETNLKKKLDLDGSLFYNRYNYADEDKICELEIEESTDNMIENVQSSLSRSKKKRKHNNIVWE